MSMTDFESRWKDFGRNAALHRYRFAVEFQPNIVLRLMMCRAVGVMLGLAGAAIWVIDLGHADPELSTIKAGLSLASVCFAVVLLTLEDPGKAPEVRLDPKRRELRVIKPGAGGQSRILLQRSFDSIGGVRLREDHVDVLEADGSILLTLPLSRSKARMMLQQQLRGVVPIHA